MSEDRAYYQLKELIRDEMLEQSPDLAKIMAKYKALVAAKDAEIAELKKVCEDQAEVNADCIKRYMQLDEVDMPALMAENERLQKALDAITKLPTLAYESDSAEIKALKAEIRRLRDGIHDIWDSGLIDLGEKRSLLSPSEMLKDGLKEPADTHLQRGHEWANPAAPKDSQDPVSYTHLTLPTNREV